MSDDDEKYKGHFEVPPQSKGGRRGMNPNSRKGLANLKPWKKGQSGNPEGYAKSVVELNIMARDMLPAVYRRLEQIIHNPESKDRDVVAAAALLDSRGCGKPATPIFHGSTGPGCPPGFVLEGDDAPSILIFRANAQRDANYKAQLQAELRRIEAEETDDGRAREDNLAAAADAVARGEGEGVPGITRLLLAAKARQAERAAAGREAAAPPPPQANPAPEPEPAAAPVHDAKAPSAKPPPFKIEPGEAPAPKPQARQARKTPPPPGAPAGYAEFLSAKATEERDDELAKKQEAARADPARYPGGQVPMSELKPDPRPPLEVVNFTRVPGGRGIKRA